MAETPLDQAFAAIDADPEAGQMRFYSVLASAELFLVLTKEAEDDMIEPETFETEDGTFVLAFDREDGLTEFVGRPAPYVAVSGRTLMQMLAGQGIGVALNPAVAPSAQLIDADGVNWLHKTLGNTPSEIGATLTEIAPPTGVPEQLLKALDLKLATMAGQARLAYLVATKDENSVKSHMLAIIDAAPVSQTALAQAVAEALTFSGLEAGALDVAFFDASDPVAARLAKHGLRFDVPALAEPSQPSPPGMDPNKPPKLH